MFEFVGSTVQGGWNAISNIASGIGRGASSFVSGFFPTPQQPGPIRSNIVAAAEGTGTTSRLTVPENPSMLETMAQNAQNWMNSPYEEQFSKPSDYYAETYKTDALGRKVLEMSTEPSTGPIQTLVGALRWGTSQVAAIRTAADEFMQAWNPTRREPINQGPREIGNSPGSVQNLNDSQTAGANVIATLMTAGSNLLNQAKGLFNTGYQGDSQPVFSIQHEIEPTVKYGMVAAGVIIVVLLLMGRFKK